MNEIVFEDVVKILINKTDFKPRFYDKEVDEYNKNGKKEEQNIAYQLKGQLH